MAERKKLLLRLDPEVYEAVARWAGDDLRSINAQIEYALRRALESAGRSPRRRRAGPSGDPGPREPQRPGEQPNPGPEADDGWP